ncbi:OsmC family protein [Ferruginibacter sp.]
MTASVIYKGDLRCECTHLQSGTVIETDAPTDNKGKGERFSPTDTICVGLATCIITTIGIRTADMNINFAGTTIDVTKTMVADPRRIGKIDIIIHFPATLQISEENKMLVQKIGDNCPVAKSLHPDIVQHIEYRW